ncbi:non-ribosomal peptide synthetase [Paenibacillus lentus]|uniref:Amino acid adenylation domain-containing protein n=1 Tax=Paenibacillus lentus TaxID=1338368 RepID=A0A3Q8SE69_9BACL|nr:non-ribosomal peptide synthetase [Paenibacillus lentus]AZK48669.1 amino acid adenylation domain-containing protein [Paenibacillus lentus]
MKLNKEKIQDIYSLSPLQKGMLFHTVKDPESSVYFEQTSFVLEGMVHPRYLEESIQALIRKHDIFRSIFRYKKNDPVQVVLRDRTAKLHYENITHLSLDEQKRFLENYKKNDRERGFDLSRDLLLRFSLIQIGETRYEFIWSHHHILMDGWCTGIVFEDLFQTYRQLMEHRRPSSESAPQYGEYIRWLQKQDHHKSMSFWKEYLEGFEGATGIPRYKERAGLQEQNELTFNLDKQMTKELNHIARTHQVTLNTVIQTLWGLLLQKYNQTDDALFGAVLSGRPAEIDQVERIVGLFINTVPVRVTSGNGQTFVDILRNVQQISLQAEKYGYISLAEIQAGFNHVELLDHIVVFENFPVEMEQDEEVNELGFTFLDTNSFEQSNYALTVVVVPGEELAFTLKYDPEVYSGNILERIEGHYKNLAEQVMHRADVLPEVLQLSNGNERDEILYSFNMTAADYPQDRTLSSLFEEQAAKYPEKLALVMGEERLTYRELNARANQWAQELRRKGVKPDQAVGLITERSPEMILAILAILKAGGAYLPIDPSYPAERVAHMLRDSEASLLIAQHPGLLREEYSYTGETLIMGEEPLLGELEHNPDPAAQPGNLAYVIYTSGSTGQPKGVMTTHQNVVKTIMNNGYLELTPEDRLLQLSNYAFDGSVFDIFGALLHGATLILADRETVLDIRKLGQLLREESVSVVFMTTALFNTLVDLDLSCLEHTRKILFGGELVSVRHVQRAVKRLGPERIIHVYGPTETTVFATSYEVGQLEEDSYTLPIGRPIHNTTAYILNQEGALQPLGVAGELWLGGDGVARGYLNQPELTAERFVPNPWEPGTMMYRTGDLARWLPEGTIEYLGRIDQQVKIRGHRIELGEIEAKLLEHPVVRETVLIARQDDQGHSSLCAYVVTDGAWTAAELRRHLATSLPEYMIPTSFTGLAQLPLTSNGKVDKRALPEPEQQLDGVYVAPANELEEQLAALFGEVLGVEVVGTQDSFFEHGGHSLKAMTLAARIHKELGVEIPLRDIFTHPTVQELGQRLQDMQGQGGDSAAYTAIERAPEQEFYPASYAQRRMYAVQQIRDKHTTAYNMPFMLNIEGALDAERLRAALQGLVSRHESLRTSFHMIGDQLMQRVHEYDEIAWDMERSEAAESAVDEKARLFIAPFDLEIAPLFRAELVQVEAERHVLMLDMHHIISDGVSTGVLFQDLSALYEGAELPPLRIQYKDYAIWQQSGEQAARLQQQEEYWLNRYAGELPVLELPTDEPRPAVQQSEGDAWHMEIDADLLESAKRLSAERGTTLYMTLLAVYQVLLSKYTGQEDIITGTPIAGRPHADLEGIVGMFVNTLAIRTQPASELTFEEYLAQVKEQVLQAYAHADYPFEELVEQLSLPRNLSRHPLFDTMFALQNIDMSDSRIAGLTFSPRELDWKNAKFDLTWMLVEDSSLRITVEYSTQLFQRDSVKRMGKHFEHLLQQVCNNPQGLIEEIELATDEEKTQILKQFNATEADFPDHVTIHELFEKQVMQAPEQTAVVFGNEHLTYDQLNRKANVLAHILMRKGIGKNQMVGIMCEPSLDMFVGILAILKAGSAYLPIDPDYSSERVEYMLEDSGAKLVIVQQGMELSPHYRGEILVLGTTPDDAGAELKDDSNPVLVSEASDLAYIIYTSGSTGQPKGVMVEHRSLVNLSLWHIQHYEVTAKDRSTKYAGSGFDASVWEIFPYLVAGSTIYIIDQAIRYEIEEVRSFFNNHEITISFLPTQFAEQFMKLECPSLRWLLIGGDKAQFIQNKSYRITNNYGPTENTVVATSYTVQPGDQRIPIGRPIANNRAYILNAQSQLQPIGVAGELCIGGAGVARGYCNRTDLTNERFVEDPFVPGNRMYRTGDIVRWKADGNIEYIGRMDDQVKIRGYRVETGEVEAAILASGLVSEAVVLSRTDHQEQTYLCAYLVVEQGYDAASLRQFLIQKLPHYMVPSFFVELNELPLTANGKVDKKALLQMSMDDRASTTADYVAPSEPMEKLLVELWMELLDVPRVGIHDNFFELGGDSIKAIQISARLNEHNLKLDVKDIFHLQTISELVSHIQVKTNTAEQGLITGMTSLSPVQQWFFDQKFSISDHWNQSMMLFRQEGWEEQAVARVFTAIMEHHDALRMLFRQEGDRVVAVTRGMSDVLFGIKCFDLTAETDVERRVEEEANALQGMLNIENGPLVQIGIFRTAQGDHLLITIHHLVVDGVSWRILTEDLMSGYLQVLRNEEIKFPAKTDSYQLWTRTVTEFAESESMKNELSYWREMIDSHVPELPKDRYLDSRYQLKDTSYASIQLTEEQTHHLLTDAHFAYSTQINDLLLSGLVLAIQEWAGVNRIVITQEGHGREDFGTGVDISRTVGWFTSMFPIIYELQSNEIAHAIKQVKEQTRRLPNKGAGWLIAEKILRQTDQQNIGLPLQPEIGFNYFGQIEASGAGGDYEMSEMPMGYEINQANEGIFPLNVSGMVTEGKLTIQLFYDRRSYEHNTIERLIQRYRQYLLDIISHCINRDKKELTPSDFTTQELTTEDLNAVFALLDE